MISRRRLIKLSAASIAVPTIINSAAWSQSWPNRHLRMVIPFPLGSATVLRIACRRGV